MSKFVELISNKYAVEDSNPIGYLTQMYLKSFSFQIICCTINHVGSGRIYIRFK